MPASFLGIDHPIVDLVVTVEVGELSELGLEPDSFRFARPEDGELYNQLESSDTTRLVPGGSGLNSLRCAAWWLELRRKTLGGSSSPVSLGFCGTVGCDERAKALQDAIRDVGICSSVQVCKELPTAKCAILVEGKTRTMVTDLGAATKMSLGAASEFDGLVVPLLGQGHNVILTTAYYINQDPAGARRLMAEGEGRGYTLALTLSAPFMAKLPIVAEFMQACRLVFGTLVEAEAFSKENGGPLDDGDAVASFIQQWPGNVDREVVITDGPRLVRVASRHGVSQYPVPAIDTSLIVDDNGAGDAFAGAFLACHMCDASTAECVSAGMQGAREALQNIGCNFRDPDVLVEIASAALAEDGEPKDEVASPASKRQKTRR